MCYFYSETCQYSTYAHPLFGPIGLTLTIFLIEFILYQSSIVFITFHYTLKGSFISLNAIYKRSLRHTISVRGFVGLHYHGLVRLKPDSSSWARDAHLQQQVHRETQTKDPVRYIHHGFTHHITILATLESTPSFRSFYVLCTRIRCYIQFSTVR